MGMCCSGRECADNEISAPYGVYVRKENDLRWRFVCLYERDRAALIGSTRCLGKLDG